MGQDREKALRQSYKYMKTDRDYKNLARSRDLDWIEKYIPKDTHTHTAWECKAGHVFSKSYNSIKYSRINCKTCHRSQYLPMCVSLASERGFLCLETEQLKNLKQRIGWKCKECSHEWLNNYSSIKFGQGCRKCAKVLPITKEGYLSVGIDRGIEWIGKELPKNNSTKTLWKCDKGHEWLSSRGSIQKGRGCHKCSPLFPKNIEDYIKLGEDRHVSWNGTSIPTNTQNKTKWKCKLGHIFNSSYNHIYNGHGCTKCTMKNEEECRRIFQDIFQKPFDKRRPEWLRMNDNGRLLELDGYEEELGVAFEYDGEQHFKAIPRFGGEISYERTKKRDAIKDILCRERGVFLIRIPFYIKDKRAYIIEKIEGLK